MIFAVQQVGQHDGVFQGQFGAGPDGEMRGMGGIPHQDHIVVMIGAAIDAREVEPGGTAEMARIAHQRIAV